MKGERVDKSFGFRIPFLGSVNVRSAPVYGLRDWKVEYTEAAIVCRPTPTNLLWRIGAILAVALVIVPMTMSLGPPWNAITPAERASRLPPAVTEQQKQELVEATARSMETYRELLGPERWRDFQQELEAKQAKREADLVRSKSRTDLVGMSLLGLYWVGFSFFVWIGWQFGLLQVLRYPFERVTVERAGDDLVATRAKLFGRSTKSCPIAELDQLSWRVRKEGGTRYAPPRWVWCVVVLPRLSSARLFGGPSLTFELEGQATEPEDLNRLPGGTRRFLMALQELTGLPASAPTIEGESGKFKTQYKSIWRSQTRTVL